MRQIGELAAGILQEATAARVEGKGRGREGPGKSIEQGKRQRADRPDTTANEPAGERMDNAQSLGLFRPELVAADRPKKVAGVLRGDGDAGRVPTTGGELWSVKG